MEKYELEVLTPYWGPGGIPRAHNSKRPFEAKNDKEAREKVPDLVPQVSITTYSEGQKEGQKIQSRAVRLIKVIENYE